jgi:hypothetical protein
MKLYKHQLVDQVKVVISEDYFLFNNQILIMNLTNPTNISMIFMH